MNKWFVVSEGIFKIQKESTYSDGSMGEDLCQVGTETAGVQD